MKKALSLLLVLVAVALPLASCGGGTPATTTPATDDNVSTAPAVTTEYPDLPEDVDCDGYEFVALSCRRNGSFNDFSTDNDNFAVVNDAIFRRNEKLCETLNCTLTYVDEVGDAFGGGPGYQKVNKDYTAGQSSYDVCSVGQFDAAKIAQNHYVLDMNEVPYIDLTNSWWDQQANKDLCVAGKMYYTTGDISIKDNLATHCILFSKTMAAAKGITDIYDLVRDKKWTFDKFSEYVLSVSEDLDGNDVMDVNDRYGVLSWNDAFQAAFAGINSRLCTVNDNGEIENTMKSERNVDIADKICKLIFNTNVSYNYINRGVTAVSDSSANYFAEGHGLFMTTMFSTVPLLRDSDMDFGIIPYPLYDETQESYGAFIGSTYSNMYCIEYFTEDAEQTGIFVELLAYYSKQYMTPAYYEQTLKGRDVTDEESIFCLDIIFASHTYDIGVIYAIGSYTGQLTTMMKDGVNRFSQIYKSYERSANTTIKALNKQFANATDN